MQLSFDTRYMRPAYIYSYRNWGGEIKLVLKPAEIPTALLFVLLTYSNSNFDRQVKLRVFTWRDSYRRNKTFWDYILDSSYIYLFDNFLCRRWDVEYSFFSQISLHCIISCCGEWKKLYRKGRRNGDRNSIFNLRYLYVISNYNIYPGLVKVFIISSLWNFDYLWFWYQKICDFDTKKHMKGICFDVVTFLF